MQSSSQPSAAVIKPPLLREPNLFDLKGHDVSISYAASSISGEPLFHYKNGHRELNVRGKDIRRVETEIGSLVTITIEMTVDAGATEFTLLIPRVKMPDTTEERISTIGFTTKNRTSFMPGPAQLQTYSTIKLSGTARFVLF